MTTTPKFDAYKKETDEYFKESAKGNDESACESRLVLAINDPLKDWLKGEIERKTSGDVIASAIAAMIARIGLEIVPGLTKPGKLPAFVFFTILLMARRGYDNVLAELDAGRINVRGFTVTPEGAEQELSPEEIIRRQCP